MVSALAGSPELQKIKREYQTIFIEKCRSILVPFLGAGDITQAGLWAMLGAAEALSYAATAGQITAAQAKDELDTIVAMVSRSSSRTTAVKAE